jgi:hypothetical protein
MRVDFTRQQATAGIAGQDDTENFEQVTEATRGTIAQGLVFNYQMGLGHDADTKAPDGMPGKIGPYYTEQGQRNFYAYWAELMGFNHASRHDARGKAQNGKAAAAKRKPTNGARTKTKVSAKAGGRQARSRPPRTKAGGRPAKLGGSRRHAVAAKES